MYAGEQGREDVGLARGARARGSGGGGVSTRAARSPNVFGTAVRGPAARASASTFLNATATDLRM